jgi:hypothetical protein
MKQSIVKRALLGATAMLALALFSAPAHADAVDFSCAGSNCTGTVAQSGGNYSTTGIGGLVQSVAGGPDYNTGAFTLVFDTSTDIASLTGNAAANNDTLLGTIVSATPIPSSGQTLLALNVNWTSLPADFQAFLNSGVGNSVGSVIYLNQTGAATSVDFTVTPTPEPATFVMLGSGLLGLCGLFRRKAFNPLS